MDTFRILSNRSKIYKKSEELNMSYIHTVLYEQAEDELKEIYDDLIKSRGKLAEVHRIQSLNPVALTAHMELYMAIMFGKSPLKRYQREMLGVVVSAENHCEYCVKHHEEALLAYWKDQGRVKKLTDSEQRTEAGLSKDELLLCRYAEQLTKDPSADTSELIQSMQNYGYSDRAILDATQVVAYFNFVNRMVLGLGVSFTEQEMKGYKY